MPSIMLYVLCACPLDVGIVYVFLRSVFPPLNVEGVYNEQSHCCNYNSLTSNSAQCTVSLWGGPARSSPRYQQPFFSSSFTSSSSSGNGSYQTLNHFIQKGSFSYSCFAFSTSSAAHSSASCSAISVIWFFRSLLVSQICLSSLLSFFKSSVISSTFEYPGSS